MSLERFLENKKAEVEKVLVDHSDGTGLQESDMEIVRLMGGEVDEDLSPEYGVIAVRCVADMNNLTLWLVTSALREIDDLSRDRIAELLNIISVKCGLCVPQMQGSNFLEDGSVGHEDGLGARYQLVECE